MADARYTPKKGWTKLATANDASTSFTAPAATATQPTTNAFSGIQGTTVEISPFGTGADNTTFDMRLVGWSSTASGLWVARIICNLSCTNSAYVGVAAHTVINTERFVDTITVNSGGANVVIPTGLADTPLTAVINVSGFEVVTAEYDMTGATNANLLWKSY